MLKNDVVGNRWLPRKISTRVSILGISAFGILAFTVLCVSNWKADAKRAESSAPLTAKPVGISPSAEKQPNARDSAHPVPVSIPVASLSSLTLPEDADRKAASVPSENAADPVRLLASVSAVRDEEKPTVHVPLAEIPAVKRFEEERSSKSAQSLRTKISESGVPIGK